MNLQKKNGMGFFVAGIIMMVIGAVGIIVGSSIDGNVERQMEYVYWNGSRDNTGSILRTIGIVVAVIGVLLFIIGIVDRFSSSRKEGTLVGVMPSLSEVYGIFRSSDFQYEFTIKPDNTCIIKQNSKYYYGSLSYTGKDTIDIVIKGSGTAYKIKPVNGTIAVKGGPVDETFIRKG